MQQVAFAPPPLPPKTRRAGGEPTVLSSSAETDVFGYSFPEVGGRSQTTVDASNHVVKIRINPQTGEENASEPCVRISVNSDMIQNGTITMAEATPNYFFYGPFNSNNVMSSGQVSPSDTLDSGTCSDLDATPPPLPKKKNAVSVTLIGHKTENAGSFADSDNDNDSNISYDSLNSGDLPPDLNSENSQSSAFLPQGLLKDIRNRTIKFIEAPEELKPPTKKSPETTTDSTKTKINEESPKNSIIVERTYEQRKQNETQKEEAFLDPNQFYNFHINENVPELPVVSVKTTQDETFAGYRDLLGGDGSSTIRSAKGTVRGVKNRVRAGIATFLQINSTIKVSKLKL